MPGQLISSNYRAPLWLPEGHTQTIVPALLMRPDPLHFERFRAELRDGDFVHIDCLPGLIHPRRKDPFVLLFHGLEGSSKSHYALALMSRLKSRGIRGGVAHWRGCSGEPNLLARSYHSGESGDVNDVVQWLSEQLSPGTPIYLVGVSLGANALLKWLGEENRPTHLIQAAVGISAPQDLEAGAHQLNQGLAKRYFANFMTTMLPKSLSKLQHFSMPYTEQEVKSCRNFHDFDEVVTARVHGFASAHDYYTRSSCKQFLSGITRPTLVLNARNDPFLPDRVLARADEVSHCVTLEYPKQGGHVGFASDRYNEASLRGRLQWLPQRCLQFFGLES